MKTMEFELIDWLKKKYPLRRGLGIGDDAAVLKFPKGRELVVTSDAVVDKIDFHIRSLSPEFIGRKSLAVNLSDIAAMGASPLYFTVTLGIPEGTGSSWIKRFYQGMMDLAARYETGCAGGDFTKASEFFSSITLIGQVKSPAVLRSGARPGDMIGVTGPLGGSIKSHHYLFEPRVREGRFLKEKAAVNSMADISDGLVQDLEHILEASSCSAVLDLDRIPFSDDCKKMSGKNRMKALEHALTDGEDFELVFTMPSARAAAVERQWKNAFPGTEIFWIGNILKKNSKPEIQYYEEGKPAGFRLRKKGYSHF